MLKMIFSALLMSTSLHPLTSPRALQRRSPMQATRRPGGTRTRIGALGERCLIRWTTGRLESRFGVGPTVAVLRTAPHTGEIRDEGASAWSRTGQPSFGGTAVIPLPEAVN